LKKNLIRNWPLYASLVVFLPVMWLTISISVSQNQGHLIYAADDPYIGMAVARNFARFGVWGVTRFGFTSSSSTILWTLLLSLSYYLGGTGELVPLWWNLLLAVLVLGVSYAILSKYKVSATATFSALLGIIILLPLPTLVLSGMEHTLQTLLSLVTVFLAGQLISGESVGSERRIMLWLLVLAPLVTATRFEGMFLVAAIAGLCLLVRRWRFALGFGVGGFLPVVVHGIISVSHGWFWFPASVLLKASLPNSRSGASLFLSVINPVFVNFRDAIHTLALLIAVLLVYILASGKGSIATESRQVMGAILVFLWVAHVEFVGASPLYRYDAHLCALSIIFVAAQLPVIASPFPPLFSPSTWRNPRNLACGAITLLLFFPVAVKGGRLLWYLPQCTTNIFEQQYQMGLFVRRYYQGSTVALNDIGAVNYLADIHCLDLMGLANPEVARAKRGGKFDVPAMRNLAKQSGTRIAIIYDDWFNGGLPPEWTRIGRWTIQHNVIAAKSTVSFYAVSPNESTYLRESLTDFFSRLPGDVIQQGH
jgi:hypothetical protein